MAKQPDLNVFTVIERHGDKKNFWQRIGSGWTNSDGSFNVELNALPVNGKMHIRPPKQEEQKQG